MFTLRKLMFPFTLLLLLLVAVPAASAAPGTTTTHETVDGTVTWTLPANQCGDLPAGFAVTGTGQRHQVTSTTTWADGSRKWVINDQVKGTATGENGATYSFIYVNHQTHEQPVSGPIQVKVTDSFVMHGQNGTNLTVGFNWRWTYPVGGAFFPPVDNWQQINTRGNPFACDPI